MSDISFDRAPIECPNFRFRYLIRPFRVNEYIRAPRGFGAITDLYLFTEGGVDFPASPGQMRALREFPSSTDGRWVDSRSRAVTFGPPSSSPHCLRRGVTRLTVIFYFLANWLSTPSSHTNQSGGRGGRSGCIKEQSRSANRRRQNRIARLCPVVYTR